MKRYVVSKIRVDDRYPIYKYIETTYTITTACLIEPAKEGEFHNGLSCQKCQNYRRWQDKRMLETEDQYHPQDWYFVEVTIALFKKICLL